MRRRELQGPVFAEAERDPGLLDGTGGPPSHRGDLPRHGARQDLAAELGAQTRTTPAYVTKVLRGKANFTLATLARIAYALEGEFKFQLSPRDHRTRQREPTTPAVAYLSPNLLQCQGAPSSASPAAGGVDRPARPPQLGTCNRPGQRLLDPSPPQGGYVSPAHPRGNLPAISRIRFVCMTCPPASTPAAGRVVARQRCTLAGGMP